jgi:hypothetical protein
LLVAQQPVTMVFDPTDAKSQAAGVFSTGKRVVRRIVWRLLLAACIVTEQVLMMRRSAFGESTWTRPRARRRAAIWSDSYWLTLQPSVWIENVFMTAELCSPRIVKRHSADCSVY